MREFLSPLISALLLGLLGWVRGQSYVLTPPYLNIAENRPITANATCGEGVGVGKESFCKLVGGYDTINVWDSSGKKKILDGQVCDICLPSSKAGEDGIDATKIHSANSANDGDISTWWQSPPISRGRKYNRIDLEIDLLQRFQVAYFVMTMADSPRPGVWALEKSMDNGQTWTPWQYFASNEAECQKYFGISANLPIVDDDTVICATEYSKILPIEGGEIFVPLTKGRPSEDNIQKSEKMMKWLEATNIRIRLMQTKTMLGHLMSVAQGDNTVTRRYYYAIKEISLGGRCVCNGHAYICPEDINTGILQCQCQHKTQGINCEECQDGFTQKKWRRYTADDQFECEPCNCNGHTGKCSYNETVDMMQLSMDIHGNMEGGGVCQECQHFTTGINCEKCIDGYFRPPGVPANATEPCLPCDCPDPRHSGNCRPSDGLCECKEAFRGAEDCSACADGFYDYPDCKPCPCSAEGTTMDTNSGLPVCVTEDETGSDLQCPCKENYSGTFCDECAPGFYNYPDCIPCGCDDATSESNVCDPVSGQCRCKAQYGGRTCDECNDGYYLYPQCVSCNCDTSGSTEEVCTKNDGECLCKEGYGGERCDACQPGWFGYPNCEQCECSPEGSANKDGTCDPVSGQCPCMSNFGGRRCETCTPGYYDYPNCFRCSCDRIGSTKESCSDTGVCDCKENFVGEKCDKCAPERFNYPQCEECNCNPDGVTENFFAMGGCASVPKGELCDCKDAVTGRICDTCKPLFWNLRASNPIGCESCECNRNGTIGMIGICDQLDGQCACKAGVGDVKCKECLDGFYGLSANSLLGCDDCGCDRGGSQAQTICDKATGQCQCKVGMKGRTCNEVMDMHYVPDLYQYQHEIEDGYRLDLSPVRFDFKQSRFPGFSWRGYAGFNQLQDEVLQNVSITKASTYNTVLRYQNPNDEPVMGTVTITGEDGVSTEHQFVLEPTRGQPAFLTVSGELGLFPSPFDLEPGNYVVKVAMDNKDPEAQEVLVDYFVLLPNEYVKPVILRTDVQNPCQRGQNDNFCRDYSFPMIDQYPAAVGGDAMRPGAAVKGEIYDYIGDPAAGDLEHFGLDKVVQLASWQPEVNLEIDHEDGKHVGVVSYFTGLDKPIEDGTKMYVTIKDASQNVLGEGEAFIYNCPYNSLCRQVVTDAEGRIVEFDLSGPSSMVNIQEKTGEPVITVDRMVLVPLDQWSPDIITPTSHCVKDPRTNECIVPRLPYPAISTSDAVMSVPQQVLDGYPARNMPRGIDDQGKQLVFINNMNPEVDFNNVVPQEGLYVIIAEYYQPDHPLITLRVNVTNGPAADRPGGDQVSAAAIPVYEAVLPLPTCAANIGCRAPVMKNDNPAEVLITEEFDITFINDGPEGAWIEYVYTIPTEDFHNKKDSILNADDSVDQVERFEKECGKDNFYVPDTVDDGFCKSSIISVSADFNDGALQCECHPDGSVDQFNCNSFGGQCQCKPHVIGKQCSRCEPEYFGFPDCKQCNCPPTATCNEETGDCICAPFVTGTADNPCSECEENTFGYDAITGCQECNCQVEGTVNGSMSCSLESGNCNCKDNVEGRQCDHCSYGSYDYPNCEQCDCDLSGTKERICDQTTAECFCKDNVEPGKCDTCKQGHFNLQENNPDGCMECFCFARTEMCSSNPRLNKTKIFNMDDWMGVTFTFDNREVAKKPLQDQPLTNYGGLLDVPFSSIPNTDLNRNTFYFQSGPAYRGSQLNSYGGAIRYNFTFSGATSTDTRKYPDVMLEGAGSTILYYAGNKIPEYQYEVAMVAKLEPRYWVTPSGNPVERDKLMVILNSLDNVYIKGSYGTSSTSFARLSTVEMDSAMELMSEDEVSDPVLSVEICQCLDGYTGSSCQLCAPGYFTTRSDKWGPICEKCNCHGHAPSNFTAGDTCHPLTGECVALEPLPSVILSPQVIIDDFCHYNPAECEVVVDKQHCQHNTKGKNCEECEVGYYGDATDGLEDSCQSCPCPLPDNNFALSCDGLFSQNVEDQVCICKPNYVGDSCEACGPGYFGEPDTPGGECAPCQCNGNIDVTDANACDRITGICQLCLFNTTGDNCERCEPWFYGDAILAKDCAPCECNREGTRECDHLTGQCLCLPGVEGERCDRCQADHWGFALHGEVGCMECGCSEASVYTQCDLETGQCTCKPGVTGQKCDRCLNGYWNLGPNGCEMCGCNTDYAIGGGCNPLNGQCECLPGVQGQNCDGCMDNHILIQNETRAIRPAWKAPFDYEEGCFPCSSCVDDLMKKMKKILEELNPILNEFKRNEASFYANQRLNYLSDQVERLKPEIALLDPSVGNRKMQPLEQSMDQLTRDSKSLNVVYKLERMADLAGNAGGLEVDGSNAVHEMGMATIKVQEVIKDVQEISEVLGSGVDPELLKVSIETAQQLLEQMKVHDFSETRGKAETELQAARGLMSEVKEWAAPVDEFKKGVMETEERLGSLEEKVVDMENQTATANMLSRQANEINFRNAAPQAETKLRKITAQNEAVKATQTLGEDLVNQSEQFLTDAKQVYSNLDAEKENMMANKEIFEKRIAAYGTELEDLLVLERDAHEKANSLTDTAVNLQFIAEQSSAPAESAIQAANAYKNILTAIEEAEDAATKAGMDASAAADMSRGVKDKAESALARIQTLYQGEEGAIAARDMVRGELAPQLETSKEKVDLLEVRLREVKEHLETINDQIDTMSDLSNIITETKKLAADSSKDGDDALASINARANEISNKKKVAYGVRNANSEYQLAITNIKKSLNEYEASPDRAKREAYVENDISTRLTNLLDKRQSIDELADTNGNLLGSIRDRISAARDALQGMTKPAVKFQRGSTLELKNPDNLEDLGTKTHVSFYVQGVGHSDEGEDGADERAFLFYMGHLEGTMKKVPQLITDDYMALQVLKDGRVSLAMDIGSGPITLDSNEPLKSNDWHQVVVNREGRDVTLIVRSEAGPEEITEDVSTAQFPLLDQDGKPFLSGSVFNLHPEFTKIYVGGFPTDRTAVQDIVRSTDMNGKIEGLVIGDKEVGLWNRKEATRIVGDNTRTKFVPKESSEMRFDGNGYVKLDPEMYFLSGQSENNIQFKFRADKTDGLMFLAGGVETGFISVSLRDSHVIFSFLIGSNTQEMVEVRSETPVTLDTWYLVRVERNGGSGTLFINGEQAGLGAAQTFTGLVIPSVSDLYVGGYPGSDYDDHIPDTSFFTGCIKEGTIGPDFIDIKNVTKHNVASECTRQVQNTLSFMEGGFVQMDSIAVDGVITVSLSFRTTSSEGLIFYMRDIGNHYVSLSMVNGALYLYAFPYIQIVTKNPRTQDLIRFNDNKWHTVSITIVEDPRKLVVLQIDDFYELNSGDEDVVPLLHNTDYETFFGGISDTVASEIPSGAFENGSPYIGCIRDAMVINKYVDFQDNIEMVGGSLGACGVKATDPAQTKTPDEGQTGQQAKPEPEEEEYDPVALFPGLNYDQQPRREGQCGLPVMPALDADLNIDSGFRFGVKQGSFLEYVKKNLPEMMVDKSRFQIDFKTTHPNGLIFFMYNDEGKKDFVALFIKNHKLVYSFNCGSGPSYLETDFMVTDGNWHNVEFRRVGKHGKLLFDSIEVKVPDHSQYSGGSTNKLEVNSHIYLGGLDRAMANDDNIKRELQMNTRNGIPGFVGCLRNLRYEHNKNGKARMKSLGTKWAKNNLVYPCSEKVERGFFFGPEGGRIRAERRFMVGLDFDITMMIKPRNLTGVLAAVKGRRDYLLLHMVDGDIVFEVDNGRGPITATFRPDNNFEFCNGKWHEIHAVKAKNVVTLSVNKIFAQPGIGVPGVSSTDTNNPLFLGGHIRPGRFRSLRPGQTSFHGCMKDVVIERKAYAFSFNEIFGDISSHVCPTI